MAGSAELLLVGPACWDHIAERGDERRPGGAVCYAARAATALGARVHALVSAGPDADLSAFDGHDVHVVPAPETLAFEHRLEDGRRRLALRSVVPPALRIDDLPRGWADTPLLVLAPLLPSDIELRSFRGVSPRASDAPHEHQTGLLAQGFQRYLGEPTRSNGHKSRPVHRLSHPSDALLECLAPSSTLFLSHGETEQWLAADFASVVARSGRFVVTRGAGGADIYEDGRETHIPAVPANELDSTGAGDVFATAFLLAAMETRDLGDAGRLAAAAAASAVEVPGPGPLPPRSELEARALRIAGASAS